MAIPPRQDEEFCSMDEDPLRNRAADQQFRKRPVSS
jgi:hypothetical protein